MTRMAYSRRQKKFIIFLATLSLVGLMSPGAGLTQTTTITPTLNTGDLGTKVTQAGTVYNITGGTRPGNGGPNLFHSFGNFSIGSGDTALFRAIDVVGTTYSGSSIQNIIGRVTGTTPSSLFGTLDTISNFPTANLFLVNPNGMVFGPNATLNVGGSFAVSTADYLKMTGGAKFYANPSQSTVLSIAPVEAFGFLPGNPATVPQVKVLGTTLNVAEGQTLSLIGEDLLIQDATLNAPSGRINLVSVGPVSGTQGEVVPDGTGASSTLSTTGFSSLGPITLKATPVVVDTPEGPITAPGSDLKLNTSSASIGKNNGVILLRSGQLVMDSVRMNNDNLGGTGQGGNIDIQADTMQLQNFFSISARNSGSGTAGDISIQTNNFLGTIPHFEDSSFGTPGLIDTSTSGLGPAGNIHIAAANSLTLNGDGERIELSASTSGTMSNAGNGGTISIEGKNVTLGSFTSIFNGTGGPGNGGNIRVVGTESVNLSGTLITEAVSPTLQTGNAGDILVEGKNISLEGASLSTTTTSSGTGGAINITATEDVSISGFTFLISDSNRGSGNAGDITIQGRNVTLNGSEIDSRTSGNGSAGRIQVTATETLTMKTTPNNLESFLSASSDGGGKAGDIVVEAKNVNMSGGAEIVSKNRDTGLPGNIMVRAAETVSLSGVRSDGGFATEITATAGLPDREAGGKGAGNITVEARTVSLEGGAQITSGSLGRGAGGLIKVSAAEQVTLKGSSLDGKFVSGLFANTEGQASDAGKGGNIEVRGNTLMLEGGRIESATSGPGQGGNIALDVGILKVIGELSGIDSGSNSINSTAGKAGNITIQGINGSGSPATTVSIDNSGIRTEVLGGSAATTSGTITITAQTLALANGGAISSSSVQAAPAGNIVLNVGKLTAGFFGRIASESTGAGKAGNITIQGINGSGSPAATVSLDRSLITTIGEGSAATTTRPGTITITAQTLSLANGDGINASTFGVAPGGNIALNVGMLTVGNSTTAISSNSTRTDLTAGNAGNITIQGVNGPGSSVTSVSLDNSTISTTMAGGTSSSVPANITIAAQSVNLSNGADITASTKGDGPAGNIELVTQGLSMSSDSNINSNAQTGGTGKGGSITFTGAGSVPTTISGGAIQAQSETSATAGNITLRAPGDLTLLGTKVSVENTKSGDAGSINLLAGNDLLVRNSQVSTESAKASGGKIELTAPHIIRLVDSKLESSVLAGSKGGDIFIDPQLVAIQNSKILANADTGRGGNIFITATGAVLVDPNSRIDASAGPAGISGSVNINSPIQVLSGTLVPLKLAYSQAGLSGDRCAADPQGQFSSFVQTGRDGVPQVPGALSPSPLSFLETLTSGSLGSPWPNLAAARLGLDSVSVDDSTRFRFHSACRS